ncbi:GNAT family N-acetyltransferase [uncultured Microbacterium sp.]|uniref:GNAT family N-acetyltransferase n=1 Tax=uncultured Microbacterium sp. TaxID=191216 RepID=UPI0025DCDF20|nr:GNAT family protein [uncultured Microbacterium sp.]
MPSRPTVTLRARTDADLDTLFALASDLDSWEQRSPRRPAPMAKEPWLARIREREADPNGGIAFVIDVDGAPVGTINLFDIDDFAHHGEVGIALIASARGQGVGTEAMRQIVEFAFVRANLRRVHLEVLGSNAAAIRSYEKAGFVVEGRQRAHAWSRGGYEDVVRMGLLRDEWSARRDVERPAGA